LTYPIEDEEPIVSSNAMDADETTYVVTPTKLTAIAATAQVLWAVPHGILFPPLCQALPCNDTAVTLWAGGIALTPLQGQDEVRFFERDGTAGWVADLPPEVLAATPAVTPAGELLLSGGPAGLLALDASGQQAWRYSGPVAPSRPVAVAPDGTVYVVPIDPAPLLAIRDGQLLWTFPPDDVADGGTDGAFAQSVTVTDTGVIIGIALVGGAPFLQALEPNGALRLRQALPTEYDGHLPFDLPFDLKWQLEVELLPPVVAGDQLVVVHGHSGEYLLCLPIGGVERRSWSSRYGDPGNQRRWPHDGL
jgi:outer membrane protein assembly factor BamB